MWLSSNNLHSETDVVSTSYSWNCTLVTPIEEKVEKFNIYVIEDPEAEDRDNGEEAIWGEMLTKNFPKSVKKKLCHRFRKAAASSSP